MASISMEYSFEEDKSFVSSLYTDIVRCSEKVVKEIDQIMARKQYVHAKQICDDAISTWYKAYIPMAYRRTESFYKIPQIEIFGGKFIFALDPNEMKWHHQDKKYIYDIAFKEGFHGGPIWRTPIPFWDEELGEAPYTKSPYEIIYDNWTNYLNGEYLVEQDLAIQEAVSNNIGMLQKYFT